jgi:uncharacterized cupredoxin-like copper-binding protein
MRPLLLLLLVGASVALGASECDDAPSRRSATIEMRYSRFLPGEITVPAGMPVTISLRNSDPIEHEWIVGTHDVHARHRTGTEPYHNERPDEVTVPAFDTRMTTLTFEHAGTYQYICHLPGHESYGMVGTLTVVD